MKNKLSKERSDLVEISFHSTYEECLLYLTTLKQQISVFQRQTIELENITLASYKAAQLIAKDKRPFTDGDFVKKCMMAVAETLRSEKIKLFSDVSFSARTITRRIREIFDNVK